MVALSAADRASAGHPPLDRERADLVDHVVLIMLWVFGLICLFLSQLREVLRQVRLTVHEWRVTMDDARSRGQQPPTSPTDTPQQPPADLHEAGEQQGAGEPADADGGPQEDDPDAPPAPAA